MVTEVCCAGQDGGSNAVRDGVDSHDGHITVEEAIETIGKLHGFFRF